MTCSNWILSVIAVIIFVLTLWPNIIGAGVAKWIIAIAALILLIVVWTGVECKYCKGTKAKIKKP